MKRAPKNLPDDQGDELMSFPLVARRFGWRNSSRPSDGLRHFLKSRGEWERFVFKPPGTEKLFVRIQDFRKWALDGFPMLAPMNGAPCPTCGHVKGSLVTLCAEPGEEIEE